ncbi:uncharacterized protein OCT59_017594 [Rhizophagus irregularis]|uniref:uncharacterized protein n=1 Tax=Rhizophagus irregularis TaxID=588596 RepID=UPI001A0E9D40|nr:hypothetical protein OCT59_017594 [Rhizophagus irregularis]GBC46489.2 hypothetical protein RIR_jg20558.t1 [Rhizophagus irregularis DAOM 181602=DAOM 197198]
MPLLSKQKRKLKEQTHTIDGKFDKKANKNSQQLIDNNSGDALVEEFFDENEDWGDDDDNEWDDLENMEAELKIYQKIKKFWLGKTLKSTYYDKYDPSGSLTKAAAGTKKITNFFNNSDIQATNLQLFNQDTLNDILSDTDSNLKEQLEKQHNQLTVIEYNYKRAIFEYLTLLNNNNGCEKVDISLKYWLLNNKLPESRHGKYQKTIRVIDDEDVAERCHIWIRKQNFNTTPATFKKFVENELFPAIGIAKEKSITIMTTTRWLKVLGYSFQQYRRGIYYDGHEREDILQYRKKFLENIFNHEKYMSKYEGEFMDRIYLT